MKIPSLILGLSCVLIFSGCTAKIRTSLQADQAETTTQSPESTIDPRSIGTEAEVEADSTIQVPAPTTADDLQSIEADLNVTVVAEEKF